MILSRESEVQPDHLQVNLETEETALQHLPTPQDGFSLKEFQSKVRESLYDKALELAGGTGTGSQKRAAEILGVSNNAVSKYLKEKREGGNST